MTSTDSTSAAPRYPTVIDLGHFRELKNSDNLARRKKISTCIHFEISVSGEVTTAIPAVDPRDAIAIIAWCTELASQMFDVYYASPGQSPASEDVCGKLLSISNRLDQGAPRES
jgi:hypothetical protein